MVELYAFIGAEFKNITHCCKNVSINGSVSEISRKLSTTFIKANWNNNIGKVDIDVGTYVYAYLDNKEIFRGITVDRSINGQEEMSITCFDYCFYLKKSKVTHNFRNTTAETGTREILQELGVSAGDIAYTGIAINRLIAEKSGYDAIMELYSQVYKQTGRKFYLVMDCNKVCVRELGQLCNGQVIVEKNVINFDFKDSMQDMVNRVKIYDDKNNYIATVQDENMMNDYGILQEIYKKEKDKDYYVVANGMLKGKTRELSVEILGNYNCRTGYAIPVTVDMLQLERETMYITSDSHTWDIATGNYITSLNLLWENNMDVKDTEEQKEE